MLINQPPTERIYSMRPIQTAETVKVIPLADCTPLFLLGAVLATPEALEVIENAGQSPIYFLLRHAIGDWTETDAGNAALNKQALTDGSRIFSVFETNLTESLYVITEGDRSRTTLVLASEY
jgi:hypothetical protein